MVDRNADSISGPNGRLRIIFFDNFVRSVDVSRVASLHTGMELAIFIGKRVRRTLVVAPW